MLPLYIPNSPIPFSLQGTLESGENLLAISDGCPITLLNPVPLTIGEQHHGYLKSKWRNSLKYRYNWAISKPLSFSKEDIKLSSQLKESTSIRFYPGSTLRFCWKSFSNNYWRGIVKGLLDINAEDISEAFVENASSIEVAYLLSPILLACEGYSVGGVPG